MTDKTRRPSGVFFWQFDPDLELRTQAFRACFKIYSVDASSNFLTAFTSELTGNLQQQISCCADRNASQQSYYKIIQGAVTASIWERTFNV
ncbi:hypothetical protein ACC684_28615 [Rhizobium ruizarguesonis]